MCELAIHVHPMLTLDLLLYIASNYIGNTELYYTDLSVLYGESDTAFNTDKII